MLASFRLLAVSAAALALCTACGKKTETAAPAPAPEVAAPVTPITPVAAATGATCGGVAAIQCASAADYCAKPAGTCGVADVSGTCTVKPTACALEYKPVCGCDGVTYPNECTATVKGASIAKTGACA